MTRWEAFLITFGGRKPSPLAAAVHELEEAQRSHLAHCAFREYYAATESMLKARIVRLQKQIDTLKGEQNESA